MYNWNSSTVILPLGRGRWRLFAPATRRNVVVNSVVLGLIDQMAAGMSETDLAAELGRLADPWVAAADRFKLWDSPHLNADHFDDRESPDNPGAARFEDFLDILREAGILVEALPAEPDVTKRSFADRHRGNFYEQIGTEALLHRVEPQRWWADQKFTSDRKAIRKTPYRYIEQAFLERFFADEMAGKSVLEIGCGTGFFTQLLARHAGEVVGLDFESDYIHTAEETWLDGSRPNLSFVVGDITDLEQTDPRVRARTFDAVVLIDTFLFLFDALYQPKLHARRKDVMHNMAQLLDENGRFLIMDPHPFWLTPWIGDAGRPVGLISEYRNRLFKVTPTLEEISTLVYETGLRIRRVFEPQIHPDYEAQDPVGYAFMAEFPQWWFFELEHA